MEEKHLVLESFLPYRLTRLAETISRDYARIYKERFGITRPEWRLLATLGELGTMTATAIGVHTNMHKTKVSRAVAALEARRWLARRSDGRDRRVEHLTLTKPGMAAYRELAPLARAFETRLMASLSTGDRKAAEAGLNALEKLLPR